MGGSYQSLSVKWVTITVTQFGGSGLILFLQLECLRSAPQFQRFPSLLEQFPSQKKHQTNPFGRQRPFSCYGQFEEKGIWSFSMMLFSSPNRIVTTNNSHLGPFLLGQLCQKSRHDFCEENVVQFLWLCLVLFSFLFVGFGLVCISLPFLATWASLYSSFILRWFFWPFAYQKNLFIFYLSSFFLSSRRCHYALCVLWCALFFLVSRVQKKRRMINQIPNPYLNPVMSCFFFGQAKSKENIFHKKSIHRSLKGWKRKSLQKIGSPSLAKS